MHQPNGVDLSSGRQCRQGDKSPVSSECVPSGEADGRSADLTARVVNSWYLSCWRWLAPRRVGVEHRLHTAGVGFCEGKRCVGQRRRVNSAARIFWRTTTLLPLVAGGRPPPAGVARALPQADSGICLEVSGCERAINNFCTNLAVEGPTV